MSQSPTMEKARFRDYEFSRKIRAEVRNLDRCYQCSACSDGCPVAYAMDYHPNQIIHMVRLGLREQVLRSRAIWTCVSCETCATRCPNEIEIVRLMDELRRECLKEGLEGPVSDIPKFHEVFVEEVRKRGQIDAGRLLLGYLLRTRDFLSFKRILREAGLGLKMFRKGKLRLPTKGMHEQKEVKEIFKKALSDE